MAKKDRFERFCEIIAEHPGIKANEYDRLHIKDRPARRTLEIKFGCSWFGLVELASVGKSKKRVVATKMNRSSFLNRFDNETRARSTIVEGIKNLGADKPEDDLILPEADFRREYCKNVSTTDFGQVAREDRFKKYRFRSKGKVFWTTPRTKKWALENVNSAREL